MIAVRKVKTAGSNRPFWFIEYSFGHDFDNFYCSQHCTFLSRISREILFRPLITNGSIYK